jgi:predicted Zn-dependent protease
LRIRGLQYMADRKPKEAIDSLMAADQIKPLTREVTLPLVQALIASDQGAEGEKLARAMIQKDGTFAPIYDVLYAYYMRNNRPADAEAVFPRGAQQPQARSLPAATGRSSLR